MRRYKLSLLAVLALAAGAAAGFVPTKAPTGPDGTAATVDLPAHLHIRNVGGSDGAGLCVFTSVEHSARWQNVRAIDGFQAWMRKRPGGGWPQKLDQMLKQFCAEKGVPVPPYLQHTGGDEAFLDLAVKTDRMPFVTYAGRDDFYRGRVAHMVSLAHLDESRAAIVDNNRPGVWLWMTRAEFLSRWRDYDGGWAGVLLDPPPPPHPAAAQRVFGQCPGGVCPVPVMYPTPAATGVRVDRLDATPVGDPPGPDFVWHELANVGWGWVQRSLVPAPPVGAADEHLTGVVPEKIHAAPAYSINGVEVSRDDAMSVMSGRLADDSDRWHLTAVGDPAFLARFKADVAALPAPIRDRVHVQTYGPSDWPVSVYRLPAGVSVRRPSPARTGADAGVIGLDVYDAAKLLALLNDLLGLVKPAPAPQPTPAPQPAPGPAPAPSPAPSPEPNPAAPDGSGWLVILAAVVALIVSLFRKSKESTK